MQNDKITIKIDREIYKKLQNIKMVCDIKTIEVAIKELVENYGDQYKQKKLIADIHR